LQWEPRPEDLQPEMIGIIDYGLGNLASVAGAVEKLGHEPVITCDVAKLEQAHKLILPGVGAFGDGMGNLHDRGLVDPLTKMVVSGGKPILGICLGSQLLARESEEFGHNKGLGWIDATVRRLPSEEMTLRIPHVGWNNLEQINESILFTDVPDDALFYYVHSYCITAADPNVVAGVCDYGVRFVAAVQTGNIYATQFHPEKSQRHGLTLLRNFLERS
jgi:imidazole glycerol-phosphate synthase subunit HisH